MTLTGKQCEQFLTTNGMGKCAQVGYDLTLKSVKQVVTGGLVGKEKTDVGKYVELNCENLWMLQPGLYSITFHQGCCLPSNIKAKITHRSSVLRCGGRIESGIYDPGFEVDEMGAFLEVIVPLSIEKNARVAQIVMEECYSVDELYNGQWQKEKDVK